MTDRTLDHLRAHDFALASLPETIHVPALGSRSEPVTLTIEAATLDDIAFARLALYDQAAALLREHHALERLHDLARQAGAVGSNNAIEAVTARGCV